MLQKLAIRNYAIIDHVELLPDGHLSIVTGETGAGKSIILGALSLILGERADTSVLINKDEKCVVEAYFDVKNNEQFREALRGEELDDEQQCIIRREISNNGKSRAFVNDTPVTLSVLNKLTSLLVDLHQQFDNLDIESNHFQMDVLDAIANNRQLRGSYHQLYLRYKKLTGELAAKEEELQQWQKEAEYKQFLFDELEQAAFGDNEIEEAELQLKQMNNAEKIISVLQQSKYILEDGEQPLNNELKRIVQQLESIADVMPDVQTLGERMISALAELKDIAAELELMEGKVNLDAEKMMQLQERIDMGYKLLKKHAVQTTNELLALHETLKHELQSTLDLSDAIDKLVKERAVVYKEMQEVASQLSKKRKEVAPQIQSKVGELLGLVGMSNARFKIAVGEVEAPTEYGMDSVSFLLDANKSGQFLPVHKAASGGEMSRIMLCIKSLTAKAMHLPTLIFDEVDTGISGEAARQVSILLQDLSQYHQVICITHQPQVAAKGSRHFFVYKEEDASGRIKTKVRVLQRDERVMAIAQMIGGEQPSEAALQNARELVTT